MASMDCLILPQPSAQPSLDASQVLQRGSDNEEDINVETANVTKHIMNEDLRNFAKSSTNLD